jgi:hypothetical protein
MPVLMHRRCCQAGACFWSEVTAWPSCALILCDTYSHVPAAAASPAQWQGVLLLQARRGMQA